jgi:hypothetical protein
VASPLRDRNDEVEAQGSSRTFYETIFFPSFFMVDYSGCSGYAFFMQQGAFGQRRPERMENTAVSLIYTDEKYEVWVDAEKDNITLSMTDRGVTILFTRDEWLEFQEVIGNIMLEEEQEEEENE